MKVDRAGTFLAKELDRALGTSKKQSLPQLAIRMQLLHWFDNEKEEWVDFSETGMEVDAYFILVYYGKDKQPVTSLSYDQLMKVYGWDGKDFRVLADEIDAPEMFMVRIEDNDPEYAGKTPFVVNWIDDKDADPHGGLKKLDAKGLAELQTKFGALINKSGKVAPPASAKKAAPVAAVAVPVVADKPKLTAAEKKAAKLEKSKRVAAANQKLEEDKAKQDTPETKAPPVAPPSVPPATPSVATDQQQAPEEFKDGYTKTEAWLFVVELTADGCSDDQRNAAWNAAIAGHAPGIEHTEITSQQWNKIAHSTLDDIGKL